MRYVKSKEDAEDLVQEAFVKIYNDLKQFNPNRSAFLTWSKRVLINTCLQHLRKRSFLTFVDNIIELGASHRMPAQALENLNLEDLTTAISTLPKGYRTVFNLHVIDGYTHAEISKLLGISEGTSKSQLLKAKKVLRKNIEKFDLNFAKVYA